MYKLVGMHYYKQKKQLLEDAAIAPVYQPGKAYLQRQSITGLLEHKYGGEFSYKWVELKKLKMVSIMNKGICL